MDHVARIMEQWARERPDLDISPQGVLGRLHRLADRTRAELVAGHTEHGLSEGEFDVLATLRRAGAPYELGAGDVARHTMVTTGAVSKRLDRLEAAGLVERMVDEDDARARRIRLTAAGLDRIDAAFAAHIAREHRLLAPLGGEDRATLARLLEAWGDGLERRGQSADK